MIKPVITLHSSLVKQKTQLFKEKIIIINEGQQCGSYSGITVLKDISTGTKVAFVILGCLVGSVPNQEITNYMGRQGKSLFHSDDGFLGMCALKSVEMQFSVVVITNELGICLWKVSEC